MSEFVILKLDELRVVLDDVVSQAIERTQRTAGERVGIDGMAARYNVSRRTICNWLKQPGKLPPRRAGQQWLLSDVQAWERLTESPNSAQQLA